MQHCNLFRAFYTFCNNRKVEFMCHIDNGIDDLNSFLTVPRIHFDELHIKFQNINICVF